MQPQEGGDETKLGQAIPCLHLGLAVADDLNDRPVRDHRGRRPLITGFHAVAVIEKRQPGQRQLPFLPGIPRQGVLWTGTPEQEQLPDRHTFDPPGRFRSRRQDEVCPGQGDSQTIVDQGNIGSGQGRRRQKGGGHARGQAEIDRTTPPRLGIGIPGRRHRQGQASIRHDHAGSLPAIGGQGPTDGAGAGLASGQDWAAHTPPPATAGGKRLGQNLGTDLISKHHTLAITARLQSRHAPQQGVIGRPQVFGRRRGPGHDRGGEDGNLVGEIAVVQQPDRGGRQDHPWRFLPIGSHIQQVEQPLADIGRVILALRRGGPLESGQPGNDLGGGRGCRRLGNSCALVLQDLQQQGSHMLAMGVHGAGTLPAEHQAAIAQPAHRHRDQIGHPFAALHLALDDAAVIRDTGDPHPSLPLIDTPPLEDGGGDMAADVVGGESDHDAEANPVQPSSGSGCMRRECRCVTAVDARPSTSSSFVSLAQDCRQCLGSQ